jgi:hypothetical protein
MSGADIEIVVIAGSDDTRGTSDYPHHLSLAGRELCRTVSEILEGGGVAEDDESGCGRSSVFPSGAGRSREADA